MPAKHTASMQSIKNRVSKDEWQTRQDLAACYRLVAQYGMTDLIYNHISARVPAEDGNYLINPYGMLYEEITASSLIKIDVEGNTLLQPDHGYSVNVAGFYLHAPIHKARPEVHCIIHTHTRAGAAVGALEEGLLPLTQTAIRFHGSVGYHEFEGPAINGEECQRVVEDLAGNDVLFLRNHGLLVCGETIPQAFNRMYWLEQACRMQVDILACGRPIRLPTRQAIENTVECFSGTEITLENEEETNPLRTVKEERKGAGYGLLEWPALLRRFDRQNPGYAS